MKRIQRLMRAINADNQSSWENPNGFNYKRFLDLGFDIAMSEDNDFLNQDVVHNGEKLFSAPQKTKTISISNAFFVIEFIFVIMDIRNQISPGDVESFGGFSTQCYCKIDNEEDFDTWLDSALWDHKIDIRDSTALMYTPKIDPETGNSQWYFEQGGQTKKITRTPDGRFIVETDGQKIILGAGGAVEVDLTTIKSVTIKNIFDLKNYIVQNMGSRIFHVFDLINEGHGEITYSPSGKLEIFTLSGALLNLTPENEITISLNPDFNPNSN